MQSNDNQNQQSKNLLIVHVCASCGRASRREERDGTPDANGVFHCSVCGHGGPLNDQVLEDDDSRLTR